MLQSHREQVAELQAELNRRQSVSAAPEPEQARSSGPEDDVVSRLRSLAILKTDQVVDEAGETTGGDTQPHSVGGESVADETPSPLIETHDRLVADPVDSSPVPRDLSHAPKAGEEEESIDNYMAQLLKRVRGVSANHQAPAGHAVEPSSRVVDPVAGSASGTAAPEPTTTVQEVPAQLARRSTAPELSSDLAAMRELANLSARSAIDTYAYRNWGRAAFVMLTIALLAAGAGGGAVYFAPAPDSMLMYAGLSSFVVTLFWLLQAGILLKNVIHATQRREQFKNAASVDGEEAIASQSSEEHAEPDDEVPAAQLTRVYDGQDTSYDQTAEQPCDVANADCDGEYAAEAANEEGGEGIDGSDRAEFQATESGSPGGN